MKTYNFNKETLKLELQMEKSEYAAMSEMEKAKLKGAFLWGKGCWISRRKEPHLWYPKQVAEELGFQNEGSIGERLSFSEQIERKQNHAFARMEKFESYANNAEARGASLQSDINDMHGDIAFFTQPNVNSPGGKAFTRRREIMFNRYDRGLAEYRKSSYYRGKAEIAENTAKMSELKDRGFLARRIRDCRSKIKSYERSIIVLENNLYQIEQGEELHRYDGSIITAEELTQMLNEDFELAKAEIDKQSFYEDKLDELGGIKFSKENIKPGYIIKLTKDKYPVKVVSTGPLNFKYKSFSVLLTRSYAEIDSIISTGEDENKERE